jgi:MFS family permease
MGRDAPSEFIIATLSSAIGLTFMPLLSPLFHRLSRAWQRRALLYLGALSVGIALIMCAPFWGVYDDMHPKRIGVHLQYNVSSTFIGTPPTRIAAHLLCARAARTQQPQRLCLCHCHSY